MRSREKVGVEGRAIRVSSQSVLYLPSQSMDRFNHYFAFHRNALSLGGLWYTQPYRERLIRYYIIGFMALIGLPSQLCQFLTSNMDLRSAVHLLQIFIPSVCFSSIYVAGILQFMTLRILFRYVEQDWQELRNDVELKIMEKHAYISKVFMLCLSFVTYFSYIMFFSPSLLRIVLSTNEVQRDIDHYPIISCFDYLLDRTTYYYPIVIYQIIVGLIVITVSNGVYSTYFSFIQHTYARLSIITYVINRPFVNNDENGDLCEPPTDLSQWVIDIVQRLARTTELVTLFNATTEKIYLIIAFVSSIVLVIDFLLILQVPDLLNQMENRDDLMTFPCFIICSVFAVYSNCYMGQALLNHCTDMYREACLVPFYILSLKTQKLWLTTLRISSKPFGISIGKFYVASHEFFISLLRTSLSFALVVDSVKSI